METLNNFASIYCYIAFVIGAVLMLVALAIAAMGKDYEPRNKVRFFVTMYDVYPELRIVGKGNTKYLITSCIGLEDFGLNPKDFADMKEGEIREVFINLED